MRKYVKKTSVHETQRYVCGGLRRRPGRKYRVIYQSVLLENLQYAANLAMGFFSYFVFIYIFIRLWIRKGADDLVCHDDGNDLVRL